MRMLEITFKYSDRFTKGGWNTQTCRMNSVAECIDWYGLGKDCEYTIVSVKPIDKDGNVIE